MCVYVCVCVCVRACVCIHKYVHSVTKYTRIFKRVQNKKRQYNQHFKKSLTHFMPPVFFYTS